MNKLITGLHHITALASDPQKNIDFYAGILGLRLVKRRSILMHLTYIICIMVMKKVHQEQFLLFPYPGIPPGRKERDS